MTINYELYGKIFIAMISSGKTDCQEIADNLWHTLLNVDTGMIPEVRVFDTKEGVIFVTSIKAKGEYENENFYFAKKPDGSLVSYLPDSDLDTNEE